VGISQISLFNCKEIVISLKVGNAILPCCMNPDNFSEF